ncbi:AAA family ATPase [Sediminispirochaeta bajacaliforniensis]|uniref:AAA family ATPase n=1 Tax=Sediminispirochaeta bajacaliforniensis TaxID=148 RepID=UPI00036AF9C1|nr:AAA family ATPase [Sediminispirochaeta bajacaliforniensis]
MKPRLYIFSGLPATGKSTLAKLLAQKISGAYLRIDTIEQGLRDLCSCDVQGEGYRLAYRIAADNLKSGIHVIADSCNPWVLTRNEWEHAAVENGADFINIEIVCSDTVEHQKRAERRTNEIAGLTLPRWEDIQKRVYHPWHKEIIRLDTAGKRIQESFDFLMRMIN